MAVKIEGKIFWVAAPCSGGLGYLCFGGPNCLHLHGEVNGAGKEA